MSALKALFLLDPEIVFLNHGSFGACPRPVFETYQTWQRALERQPVAFLGRQAAALLAHARSQLAAYLGVAADDVVYEQLPRSPRRNGLPVKLVDRALLMHHQYPACALV